MLSSFYSWRIRDTQTFNPVLRFTPGCPICLPENLPAALLGSMEMQKHLGECCSTWKPTTTTHCSKDVPGGTKAAVEDPAPHQSSDQCRNIRAPGHHQAFPTLRSPSLVWQVSMAGGAQPHLHHRSMIFFPLQKLGHEVKYSTAQWAAILSLGLFVTF